MSANHGIAAKLAQTIHTTSQCPSKGFKTRIRCDADGFGFSLHVLGHLLIILVLLRQSAPSAALHQPSEYRQY